MPRRDFSKVAFAATGDVNTIPGTVQPDGSISLPSGWGFDYERNNGAGGGTPDPLAKNIDREDMNGILNEITASIGEIQQNGLPAWVATAAPYPINAQVRSGNIVWQSVIANNNDTPGATANWVNLSSGEAGRVISVQVISTVGSSVYTPSPGAKTVKFTVQAGGARGGNTAATSSTQICVAPGGGAGACAVWEGPVATAAGLTMTVGAGGTQATPGGGTSSVGTLATALGGSTSADGAALAPSAGSAVGIPGVGGTYTNGDSRSGWGESGIPSFTAQNSNSYSGSGGSSRFGGGGRGQQANAGLPGEAAVSRGAGGGGAAANISKAAQLGGNGGAGIIIIEERS